MGNKDRNDTLSHPGARPDYLSSSREVAKKTQERVLPVDAASIDTIMSGRFRLDQAPTLAAPSLSDNPIAFTRLQCDNDKHGPAGPVPPEGSFAFQVMLKPLQSWELCTNRGHGSLPPTIPGDTFLFDLTENPRIEMHSAFDMVRFYMPRSALDSLAYGRGLRRVAGLRAPAFGVHDPIMYGMALSMIANMIGPAQPLFVEYMALAFHAHVVHMAACRKVVATMAVWRRGRCGASLRWSRLIPEPITPSACWRRSAICPAATLPAPSRKRQGWRRING
jgi:AraC family transcriptional regulator